MARLVKQIPYLSFLAALIVFLGVGGFAVNRLNALLVSSQNVKNTLETVDELEVIRVLIAQVETGENSYVITGDEALLDLYKEAIAVEGLPTHLANLRERLAGNPSQLARLDDLELLLADRLTQAQQLIELRRNEGLEPARQMVASGVALAKMKAIRTVVAEIDKEEDSELETVTAIENTRIQEVVTSLVLGALFIIALSTGALVMLNREGSRRRVAERNLLQLNNELEMRIQERTAELKQTNTKLEAEAVERVQAEAALAIGAARFQALIENSSDGITLFGMEGTILYVSPSTTALLGYPKEELIGRNAISFIHPDEQKFLIQTMRAVAKTPGKRGDLEARIRHKDGSWRWMESVLTNLLHEPSVGAIVNNYRDITDHKLAEDKAARERALLRTVIDNMADQVFVKDRQGRFLIANTAVVKARRFDSEAGLLGKSDLDLFEGEAGERYFADEQALMAAGQGFTDSDFFVDVPNEPAQWIQITKVPLREESGQVIGLVGLIRDITERKLAEESVRESEAHYHLMFESSPLPMWVFDVESLAFVSVNEAAIYHYGYTREEFMSMTIKEIRPAEDVTALMASVREVDDARRKTGVWRHRKKDGTLIDVEIFTHDLQFAGRPSRLVLANDITERKQAEAAQAQANLMFRALFDNSPDAIVLIDTRGDWPIVDCNEAACMMNGYNRDELLGQSIDILNADPNALIDRGGIYERLITLKNIKYETIHRRKDGSIFPIEVSSTLINIDGQELILGIDRDITERKRRLRELEAIAAVSGALRTAETRREMLPVILDQLMSLLDAEAAAIDMKDPGTGEVVTELGRGSWAGVTGQRQAANEPSVTNAVIAGSQPYLNDNLTAEPRVNQSVLVGTIRSVAAWPLVTAQQKHIGALWLGRNTAFSPAEVSLFGSVADIAATAINRANLHEETSRHLQNMAALRDIDRAIASSLDLKLTLAIILGHVVKQLEVDAASVLILADVRQALLYAAGVGFRSSIIKQANVRLGEAYAGKAALERKIVHVSDFTAGRAGAMAGLIAAEGFVDYYAVPLMAKGKVSGVLELFHRRNQGRDQDWLEFLNALAGQAAIAVDNVQLFENLQRSNLELALAYDATIEGWSKALDLRDKETEGHSQRVTELTLQLARAMGMSDEQLVQVRRGALLHDIGKMGVPDHILLKPGQLTDDEWVRMKEHPSFAYSLLAPIVYLRPALDIPYCHHEKWDGTGYPRGLKGEQIPLAARIFAIVDVWDALRSDRPYREGWPVEKVRAHIRALSGIHFDPRVVETFLVMV